MGICRFALTLQSHIISMLGFPSDALQAHIGSSVMVGACSFSFAFRCLTLSLQRDDLAMDDLLEGFCVLATQTFPA